MSIKSLVNISKNEYLRLKITEARMDYLEASGVDNWSLYGCQCDITCDNECIFCTEDEEEFLGLKD